MSEPRFELVHSDAGWHARFRSSNGKVVMSSEVYTRRRGALRAIELIAGADVYLSPFQDWPEIDHGHGEHLAMVEIRDVDERDLSGPPSLDDAQALGRWAEKQPSIRAYLDADKKIHAIRDLRIATNASLLQSKLAIESAVDKRKAAF